MNEVVETSRKTKRYLARSAGHNDGSGVTVIGPVLVTIDVVTYEAHTASYYVSIDGRHQFGGFAHHLDHDGLPSARFLDIGTEIDPRDERMTTSDLTELRRLLVASLDDPMAARIVPASRPKKRQAVDLVRALDAVRAELDRR